MLKWIFLVLGLVFGSGAGPVWAASGDYDTLRRIAEAESDYPLYLFQLATKKCWRVRHAPAQNGRLAFSVAGHSGVMSLNLKTGSAEIPWRWKIEKAFLSSAEQVVNRCMPSEQARSYTAGRVNRLDSGVPYLWTFKSRDRFCARAAVYTTCRTECRLTVPVGAEIYGIALTKQVAEDLVNTTCME